MDRYFSAQADEEYRSWAKSDKKIFKKIERADEIYLLSQMHDLPKSAEMA